MHKTLLFLITLSFLTLNQTVWSQSTKTQAIHPPFGLAWGESSQNTRKWIEKNKHKHIEGKAKDGRHVIEVQGPFPEVNFERVRFYFSKEELTEVELQFNQIRPNETPTEEAQTYTDALELKNVIDSIHGPGVLIKNESSNNPKNPWKYIHQIWTDEEHSIWLVVFHSKKPQKDKNPNSLSMTSLHYRWEKKLMPQPAKKEVENKNKKDQ